LEWNAIQTKTTDFPVACTSRFEQIMVVSNFVLPYFF
jgi:hypothetical protein